MQESFVDSPFARISAEYTIPTSHECGKTHYVLIAAPPLVLASCAADEGTESERLSEAEARGTEETYYQITCYVTCHVIITSCDMRIYAHAPRFPDPFGGQCRHKKGYPNIFAYIYSKNMTLSHSIHIVSP